MMTLLIPAGLAFFGFGAVLWSKKRNTLKDAMTRDGFKPFEVRKALKLYDRNQQAELVAYCRDVVERHAVPTSRDWTKAESYRELV
jgi:hypothetical protein